MKNRHWLALLISMLALASHLQGQERVSEVLTDRTLNMKLPADRAKAVERMKIIEERRLQNARARGRALGIPLTETLPNGGWRELVDFDAEGPVFRRSRNLNAAISTGANLTWTSPHTLNGSGLIVGVWDGGMGRPSHQEFATGSRLVSIDGSTMSDHSMHVAGTIGALGVNSSARGMANAARIHSYTAGSDKSEMTAVGATAGGQTATKVYTSNHSYGPDDGWRGGTWGGTGTDQNAYDPNFGQYNTNSRDVDSLIYSTPYLASFWACGNDRTDNPGNGSTVTINGQSVTYNSAIHPAGDGVYRGGYETINAESIGKNIIAIGAVNDAVTSGVRDISKATISTFSSTGPADDGRIKPDLVANGVGLSSTDIDSDTDYKSMQGTSMASPNACGSATLLVDQYNRLFSSAMRASTLKALLIHTADDIGRPGPDYFFGWGLINVKKGADLIASHAAYPAAQQITESNVSTTTTTRSYSFTWDGTSPITATIAWTDPAAAAVTAHDSRTPVLVNNLNLKVIAPNGAEYFPYVMPFVGTWTLASMSANATTGINNVDNVEQVRIAAPGQAGVWRAEIGYTGTITNTTQDFGLVISGLQQQPNSIVIQSPNGGETFTTGSSQTISWTSGIGGDVSIELLKNGTLFTTIAASTPNDGSYSWSIPSGQTLGSDYRIRVSSIADPGKTSTSNSNFSIIAPLTLANALDTSGLTWTNSGNANWFYQSSITHDGQDAANSGAIGDSQTSSMETTLAGPGTLTFWWKVSSESGYDFLELYLNGIIQTGSNAKISGEVDWVQKTLSIPAGSQVVRWTYMKDGSVVAGSDAAFVDEVVYAPSGSPEIAVEQPVGTGLADGSAMINFGSVNTGSSSSALAFTIRNTGTANLTGLSLSKSGTHSADYTLGGLGATALAPGASTTFTATFTPGAAGTRTAAIQIASNDADENPFDINLTGVGTVPQYAVTFDASGGSAPVPASILVTAGSTYGTLATTARTGYTFNGWFTAASGGTLVTPSTTVTATANHTLYARWNALPVVDAGPNQTVSLSAGSAWSPSQIAPQLWLDADDTNTITLNGATVSQWNDKSTFGRHATATGTAEPTATAAGLNGKRVITFDGSTDVLAVNLDFLAGVSHSAFIVTKPTVYSNIYGAANGSAGANSLHVGFNGGSYRMNFWANDYGPVRSANFVTGSANIMNYVWLPGSSKQILANGKSEGTNTNAGTIGTMAGGGRIGRAVGQGFFGGDIAELIIITGAVSATDREKMEGYLAHKWGLAGNLALNHPHKTTAPGSSTAVANLDATATDTDSLTTAWTLVSGPAGVSFGNSTAIDTTATFNVAGTYTLRLTANDGNGPVSDDAVITVNPVALHSVTYNGNGNTGGNVPVDAASPYTSGTTVSVLGNTGALVRTGYTFAGWNTAGDGSGTNYAQGATFNINAQVTLYAQWTANSYTITFDANGGDAPTPANKSVVYDSTYGTLASTARSGYTFNGWFTAASGGTLVANGTTVAIISAQTLYAQWTANSYTVTFDANGGDAPTPANKTVVYDTTYGTLASTARNGYTFNGWFTAASGGTLVTSGTTVAITSAQTLFAQWTANSYTVTFDANGGSSPTPANKSVVFDSTYGTLATSARTGYAFNGWFTAASGGILVTSGTTVAITSAQTLYAQWTIDGYYWDANGTTSGQTNGAGAWLGTNLWSDGTANQSWVAGASAIFGGANTAGGAVTLASPTTVNEITFNQFTGSYTLGTAGQTLTVNGNLSKTPASGTVSIISPIAIGGPRTWTNNSVASTAATFTASAALDTAGNLLTVDGTGTTALTGVISGSGGIVKSGSGKLALHTGNPNTYTGPTTINGGVLMMANNAASLGGGNVTLNGGVLEAYWGLSLTRALGAGAGQIQVTGGESGFGQNGGGANLTVNFGNNAANEAVWGSTHFNPSILVFQSQYSQGASSVTLANNLDLNGATRTIHVAGGVTGAASAMLSGVVRSSSGTAGLIKTGAGNLILSAANTFTGNIAVNTGSLQLGNNTAATLTGGNYAGAISVAGGSTLRVFSSANQTLSGAISGGGGLNKAYAGTLTLSAANTYTGKTSITPQTTAGAGTVSVSSFNSVVGGTASSSLGAPTTVANGTIDFGNTGIQGGAILRYTGAGETTDRVLNFLFNGTGATKTLDASGTGLLKFTSPFTGSGSVNNDITLTGTGNGEITGGLPFAFRNFAKSGSGTWTLGGTVGNSGTTTVSAGRLALGANNVLSNIAPVSIAAAILDAATYDDVLGTLDVTAAATVNLGTGGSLQFADSSAVDWTGGTLAITGDFVPGASIRFGNSSTALTSVQLAKISAAGFGTLILDANGYLTEDSAFKALASLTDDPTGGSFGNGTTGSGSGEAGVATSPLGGIGDSAGVASADLPLPWTATDIGTGMIAGSTTQSAGTFTQAGSGIIGSTADELRYSYQTLTGDGEIIAKISSLQDTGTSSRIGVMIRDTLAPNSKEIFMGMTGTNTYRWDRRTTTGGSTSSTNSSTGTVPNTWLRLVRSGATITAYRSTDGTTWTSVGSTTNTTFASTCYIGLAVGSGSTTTLNTSQFSNVSVTP